MGINPTQEPITVQAAAASGGRQVRLARGVPRGPQLPIVVTPTTRQREQSRFLLGRRRLEIGLFLSK